MAAEVPQTVLEYLDGQKLVRLATATSDGTPHASTFMFVNDGVSLYFWARPTSTTAEHIRGNPTVSFTIDEYVEDWNKAKGVQGEGKCELVSDGDELAQAIKRFADKFPSPSSGASTTNISFYRIRPTQLRYIDNSGSNIDVSEEDFGMEFHREEVL
jgi:nitroimidazol reductase NimA-like FMN-containing flavoprotein (pyridoxamine 5'-phosphate oxidase superfamily)